MRSEFAETPAARILTHGAPPSPLTVPKARLRGGATLRADGTRGRRFVATGARCARHPRGTAEPGVPGGDPSKPLRGTKSPALIFWRFGCPDTTAPIAPKVLVQLMLGWIPAVVPATFVAGAGMTAAARAGRNTVRRVAAIASERPP